MRDREPSQEPSSGLGGAAGAVAGASGRLERLAGELPSLAGDPPAAVRSVESLRAALWEELLGALHEPAVEDVAELSDRLAALCSTLLAALLTGRHAAASAHARPSQAGEERPSPGRAGAGASPHPEAPSRSPAGALIVDESRTGGPPPAPAPPPPPTPPSAAPTVVRPAEIAVRDERLQRDSAVPIATIARQLRSFDVDHRPFAVLVVELGELEPLRSSLTESQLERLDASVEDSLLEALAEEPSAGSGASLEPVLLPERPGRYWLVAPGVDRDGADYLASRIQRALGRYAGHSGRARGVLVGIALCPENARTAPALAAHADVDLYAARAALAFS